MATFRIAIPNHVHPNEEFQVMAGERIVRVRCPPTSKPGQSLQINLPWHKPNCACQEISGTRPPPFFPEDEVDNLTPDTENVIKIPQHELLNGESSAYKVKIPQGIRPGQTFPVTIHGQQLTVTCPPMGRPDLFVRVNLPPKGDNNMSGNMGRPSSSSSSSDISDVSSIPKDTQRFEVSVPKGVKPGQSFALFAGGARVLVTCPRNATNGQKIRFDLPLGLVNSQPDKQNQSALAKIKLNYDRDGWSRIITMDMKFQWTRFDEKGNVDARRRFNADRSAYVLRLDYLPNDGNTCELQQGRISLVTPEQGLMASNIKRADGSELVSYSDIVSTQGKPYREKEVWFKSICKQLRNEQGRGLLKITLRRSFLLNDSIDTIMSLSREDMQKKWMFDYVGEEGLDYGGLKTDWFDQISKLMFDPNIGLFESSANNQMCMQINPASELCCPEDHLICFRFIGRVMGKALLDCELVQGGHMVKYLYKHLLRWPVMLNDLKDIDEGYYKSLNMLKGMGSDIEYAYLDFTTVCEMLGSKQTVELIPGGAETTVTEENLPEYIEACLKYRLMGRCKAQLNELLCGFYDVIPEALLTVFDFQELELLMCGLPEIDVTDWMNHTEYTGEFYGPENQVCTWFWEVVNEYDQELKARLLQFVTGTSGVPSCGFGYLKSNDDNVRLFSIHGVHLDTCVYPRSHTCFNRLDLPLYETKEELAEKVKVAITMAATGFDLE